MSSPIQSSSFGYLPVDSQGPPYNAWGLYGPHDELGRLNLITRDSINAARDTITEGIVVNLNLPLDFTSQNPTRKCFHHHIIPKGYANDDEITLNTQTSTQWDGFRHWPYHDWPSKGVNTHFSGMTAEEATSSSVRRYGVDTYTRKPITSRAHLLDIPRYLRQNKLPALSHFDNSTPISPETLQACADWQGNQFRSGDILLVRSGWVDAYLDLNRAAKVAWDTRKNRTFLGVETSVDSLRWHWDHHFAAVASDFVAYESWPPSSSPSLHEVFLSGWGMPIGELFDLEELAQTCERLGRWTFLLSSVALYIPGGIASPANAQAIL